MLPLGGSGGRPWLGQVQIMAPAINNGYDVSSNSSEYRLSGDVLKIIGNYAQMDTASALRALKEGGLDASLRDVQFARALLE